MDQVISEVALAVERGAKAIRDVVDMTGLSRLKVERALRWLEKQNRLIRDSDGFRTPGARTKQYVRQCGSCNGCCDILEVAAVAKPANTLCSHWETGKGCTIYDRRPRMCRSFTCAWLQGHFDDDWFPEKARMVVHFSENAVNVQVDAGCPHRWREEPYFSKLCELSLNGIRPSGNPGYATLVVAASDRFLLLGRTAVPDPTVFGTAFVPVTAETFRYWKARSQEHAQRLNERVMEIQRIRQQFGYCAIPDDDDPHPPYRPALLRLSRHPHADTA